MQKIYMCVYTEIGCSLLNEKILPKQYVEYDLVFVNCYNSILIFEVWNKNTHRPIKSTHFKKEDGCVRGEIEASS